MSLRIFISHGAGRDAGVRAVLDNIVPRLTASGYDVFVDVEKLRAGDEWHEVLYREMYQCDAAIVLLGPETVAAPRWVRREAEVLVGRFKVGGLSAVLPGIVGAVSTAEARKQGFDALLSIQAATWQSPDGERPAGADTLTVADRIMAEFSPQDLRTANPGARDWALRVARYLESARRRSPSSLLDAARRLGLTDEELVHVSARIGAELFLSHRMLSGGIREELPTAVEWLKPALGADQLRQLSAEVLPSWVDQESARRFLPAAAAASEPYDGSPVLVFNAYEEWTVEQYVRRAVCNAPDTYSFGALERGLPDDDASSSEALEAACRTALRQVFRVPPRMPLNSRTVQPKDGTFSYLVLSAADHAAEDLAQVTRSLRDDFPWLIVVVLTGGAEPGPVARIADTVVVVPPITVETELAAYHLKQRLDAVVQDSGTFPLSEVS
ncbi:toll/interleukin-1 receptor domain-containing protein [Streptomyces cyaneofuscatus]|uniref:toll/interleukin-1 receptor domain-containing protein n=1 Tax=Streptomyces cyaneofuscatus TaxID=66883 RepID=UPI0036DBAF12